MRYKKVTNLIPEELLQQIQTYVEGALIYIPKRTGCKKPWGSTTSIREELFNRNQQIYQEYLSGISSNNLADKYFLSLKSIQRIIREQKNIA